MVQTVEGAGKEIVNILTRMKELAIQASTGTLSSDDRSALNAEFSQLEAEITRIETNTKWNTLQLMDGLDSVVVQVGDGSTQTMSIAIGDWSLGANTTATAQNARQDTVYGDTNGTADTTNFFNMGDLAISGADGATAQKAVTALDYAITNASAELAKYGAYINRLEYAQDNLLNVAQNTDASRSRIEDADYASETSELAKTQIISQAGTAMLAQANQIKQTVLALLQ
jgi:flagellin